MGRRTQITVVCFIEHENDVSVFGAVHAKTTHFFEDKFEEISVCTSKIPDPIVVTFEKMRRRACICNIQVPGFCKHKQWLIIV